MAREILRFCNTGIITNSDGMCWQVHVVDGAIIGHNRVQNGFPFYAATCRTSRLDHFTVGLGGVSAPGPHNGFDVLCELARNEEGPSELLLRDTIYNRTKWLAYRTGHGWKAEQTSRECPDVIVSNPTPNVEPEFIPAGQNFTSITESIDWRIALAIALFVIVMIIAVTR